MEEVPPPGLPDAAESNKDCGKGSCKEAMASAHEGIKQTRRWCRPRQPSCNKLRIAIGKFRKTKFECQFVKLPCTLLHILGKSWFFRCFSLSLTFGLRGFQPHLYSQTEQRPRALAGSLEISNCLAMGSLARQMCQSQLAEHWKLEPSPDSVLCKAHVLQKILVICEP